MCVINYFKLIYLICILIPRVHGADTAEEAFTHLVSFERKIESAHTVSMTINRCSGDSNETVLHYWKSNNGQTVVRTDADYVQYKVSKIYLNGHYYLIINNHIIHESFQDALGLHLLNEIIDFSKPQPRGNTSVTPCHFHGELATRVDVRNEDQNLDSIYQRITIRSSDGALLAWEHYDSSGIKTSAVYFSDIELNKKIEPSILQLSDAKIDEAGTVDQAIKLVSSAALRP